MSVEGIGSVAGPAAIGLIIDLQGPRAGMQAVGACFLLLTVLTAYGFQRRVSASGHEPRL